MINTYIQDNYGTVLYVREKIIEDDIIHYICDEDYYGMKTNYSEGFLKEEFKKAKFTNVIWFKIKRIASSIFPYTD